MAAGDSIFIGRLIGRKKEKEWAQSCYSNRWGREEDPRCIRKDGSDGGHTPLRNLFESNQCEEEVGAGAAVLGAAGLGSAPAALQAVQEYQ